MKIVTGYRGIAHITSSDVGAFYASMFGDGQYVLDSGNKLAITVVSNNQVRIGDGDILMNGRHITMDKGTSEDFVFENNSATTNRNDLIVCRYTKSSGTGVENAELRIIKGTATTGTASDPSYHNGNILNGDDVVDMPLYRVKFTGITMGTPEALFTTLDNVYEHIEKIRLRMDVSLGMYATTAYVDNAKASKDHTHDDLYYRRESINTMLNGVNDTINEKFGDLLVTKKFYCDSASSGNARFNVAMEGYTALGIVGYNSNTANEVPYYVGMVDATTALLQYPSTATGGKYVTILYAKNMAV